MSYYFLSEQTKIEPEFQRGYAAGRKNALREIRHFVMNHVSEVHNRIGGVIGYVLKLDDNETEALLRRLEP